MIGAEKTVTYRLKNKEWELVKHIEHLLYASFHLFSSQYHITFLQPVWKDSSFI